MVERRAYISGVAGSIPASGIEELVFVGYSEVALLGEQLTEMSCRASLLVLRIWLKWLDKLVHGVPCS